MRTERRLLNKYLEFTECLSKATLSFKKKGEIEELNRILKEILVLRKRFVKEAMKQEINDTQMMIKFRRHGRKISGR
jgi:hypothetical protein